MQGSIYRIIGSTYETKQLSLGVCETLTLKVGGLQGVESVVRNERFLVWESLLGRASWPSY